MSLPQLSTAIGAEGCRLFPIELGRLCMVYLIMIIIIIINDELSS